MTTLRWTNWSMEQKRDLMSCPEGIRHPLLCFSLIRSSRQYSDILKQKNRGARVAPILKTGEKEDRLKSCSDQRITHTFCQMRYRGVRQKGEQRLPPHGWAGHWRGELPWIHGAEGDRGAPVGGLCRTREVRGVRCAGWGSAGWLDVQRREFPWAHLCSFPPEPPPPLFPGNHWSL